MKAILSAHSGLRYVVLLMLIIAVVNALVNLKSSEYSKKDKLINLLTLIFVHIQILLGFIVYYFSDKVQFNGTTMKNDITRFFTMEHGLMMIIAAVLVTIGKKKAEKNPELGKGHKRILIYYGISLLIIFYAIPWPFLRTVGANYF